MAEISEVCTPSEWGESFYFYEGIENLKHRRALALLSHFGDGFSCVKVCFVDDLIVIASSGEAPQGDGLELVVRSLDEFITSYSAEIERDAEPMALRWLEKIVHWPDLGC